MKTKLTQAKYRCKRGCGCKLCKPHKGGHANRRTVRDVRLSQGHGQEIGEITPLSPSLRSGQRLFQGGQSPKANSWQ